VGELAERPAGIRGNETGHQQNGMDPRRRGAILVEGKPFDLHYGIEKRTLHNRGRGGRCRRAGVARIKMKKKNGVQRRRRASTEAIACGEY